MPLIASLVGKRVEVVYRAQDIHMCVTATLTRDSGDYIHLQDRFTQSGRENTLCIAIPYSAVLRIREVVQSPDAVPSL